MYGTGGGASCSRRLKEVDTGKGKELVINLLESFSI
jgi:hypothetical protein